MPRPNRRPQPVTDEAAAILRAGKPDTPAPAPPEDTPPPTFPAGAWRGLFNVYRRAMEGSTEASDVAHFATFWTAVAVILGRKVRMFSGIDIYPNVYLCFYGPSNDKKTTAQRRIMSHKLLPDNHGVAILSNAGSVQGMADIIATSDPGVSLMLPEELSVLYTEGHSEHSTLLEFFTETFDCPDQWDKPYRQKPVSVDKPTPSIFGCTTPTWFWKHARPDDFAGGFGNRFLYLDGAKKDPIPEPEKPDPHDITEIRNAIAALKNLNDVEVRWNKDARDEWEKFYIRFGKDDATRSPLLMEAVKRCPVYVRKLSMVYAALESTLPEITAPQLRAAIEVIEYAIECAERLIDQKSAGGRLQSYGELETRVLGWVTKHGESKVRDLQQAMSKYCDAESFNRALRSLELANRIETRWDKDGPKPKRFVSLITG